MHFNEEHTAPSVHVSVQSIVGQDKQDQHEIAVIVTDPAAPPLMCLTCLLLKSEIDLLFNFRFFLMFLFFII